MYVMHNMLKKYLDEQQEMTVQYHSVQKPFSQTSTYKFKVWYLKCLIKCNKFFVLKIYLISSLISQKKDCLNIYIYVKSLIWFLNSPSCPSLFPFLLLQVCSWQGKLLLFGSILKFRFRLFYRIFKWFCNISKVAKVCFPCPLNECFFNLLTKHGVVVYLHFHSPS